VRAGLPLQEKTTASSSRDTQPRCSRTLKPTPAANGCQALLVCTWHWLKEVSRLLVQVAFSGLNLRRLFVIKAAPSRAAALPDATAATAMADGQVTAWRGRHGVVKLPGIEARKLRAWRWAACDLMSSNADSDAVCACVKPSTAVSADQAHRWLPQRPAAESARPSARPSAVQPVNLDSRLKPAEPCRPTAREASSVPPLTAGNCIDAVLRPVPQCIDPKSGSYLVPGNA